MLPLLAAALVAAAPAAPPMDDADLPPELAGWADWVRWEHPDWACPLVAGVPACVWPGRLAVVAAGDGASLVLDVHLDAAGAVVLPGGPGAWPQGLTAGGRPVPVRVSDVLPPAPTVDLGPGDHRLAWSVPWTQRPTTLQLPSGLALVDLVLDGEPVQFPLVDGEGRLRLGAVETEGPAENRLELDVFRRVRDGVPVVVSTRVDLRAAGQPREIDLGAFLLAGTRPVAIQADLPARVTPEGTVVVQVRPGRFSVTVEAVSIGPVAELAPPALPPPWPTQEVWSFQADDRVRTVNLSGPAGVDPARTSMPGEWSGLPAFLVEPGVPLRIEELRRGEPEAPVNALVLARELWLDLDGRGWTIRDGFSGTQSRDWRFDLAAPAVLGQVIDHGVGQVVTGRDGRQGVEVRSTGVALQADARVEGAVRTLPAVGWHLDVQQLSAVLHLPPGWELVWASGVDHVDGLVPWSLFDLFYVLVVALGFGRLLGWRWGGLALVALGLSRHAPGAPDVAWVLLLVLSAVERVVPDGLLARGLKGLRWTTLVVLFGTLVVFAVGQIREGVFPQLGDQGGTAGAMDFGNLVPMGAMAPRMEADASVEGLAGKSVVLQAAEDAEGAQMGAGLAAMVPGSRRLSYLSKQSDPAAVVQTGPGIPAWSWRTYGLQWSGPVGAEPTMTLWLLPPVAGFAASLLRLALLLALALRLTGVRVAWRRAVAPAAAFTLALTALPSTAEAAPDAAQLEALAGRLHPPPPCTTCAEATTSTWTVRADTLRIEVQIDAAVDASWPLPGPAATWVPARLTVDGAPTLRLRRGVDGALQVRVPAGVHRLVVEGPLPPVDVVALQLPQPPRRVVFTGEGWTAEGLKADGTVGATLQLVRASSADAGRTATSAENLAPWVEVRRYLDLGIPWRVRTEVARVGPSSQPLALRVPLLPGESITDDEVVVEGGEAVVTLPRDGASRSWTSSLDPVDRLVLTAPEGVAWTEVWTLSCSPIFACAADGPAPILHTQEERWSPTWRPWPGEAVTLTVARPDAVVGQTVTVDGATLRWRPGLRLGEGEVDLTVRTSQGGQLPLTLPGGASLREVTVGGVARPLQLRDDGVLAVPLQPGSQQVVARWQQPHDPAFSDRVPEVRVGAPVVNATVEVTAPPSRWILALRGPAWGPVPLYWLYLGQVLVAALLLARLPYAPLRAHQWALLGLGLTQVPVAVPILVVLAFLALGARRRHPPAAWWAFDLLQLGLVGTTMIALGLLYWAIHAGLLVQPDMQVEGNGSSDHLLRWYVDRTEGALPTPAVVSLPLWTFRVAMLAWSLWLAWSLVGWARWAWACWTEGGLWMGSPARQGGAIASASVSSDDTNRS